MPAFYRCKEMPVTIGRPRRSGNSPSGKTTRPMNEHEDPKANRNINPMKNSPIRPQSLAEIVADRLKAAILRRELALGEALSEEKIAAAMEVSRTPVREALTMLQLQGLITILPRRGSFVFKPDQQTLHSLVEYRVQLELLAADWATQRAPEALHSALMQAIAIMEKARDEDDSFAYATADTQFHEAFIVHCGNPLVIQAYGIAAGRLAAIRSHLAEQLGLHRQKTLQEHHQIARAVEARDAEQLRLLLKQHIEAMEPNYANALTLLDMRSG